VGCEFCSASCSESFNVRLLIVIVFFACCICLQEMDPVRHCYEFMHYICPNCLSAGRYCVSLLAASACRRWIQCATATTSCITSASNASSASTSPPAGVAKRAKDAATQQDWRHRQSPHPLLQQRQPQRQQQRAQQRQQQLRQQYKAALGQAQGCNLQGS
jgi:hypothetical protein